MKSEKMEAFLKAINGNPKYDLENVVKAVEDAIQQETGGCWCHACNKDVLVDGWLPYNMSLMILCPVCGDKRCPHAYNHVIQCTNSNKPGQKGSVYGGLGKQATIA